MPPEDKQYWIRNEQGSTWGPYTLQALDRLRGQLTERAEASLDGQKFRPGSDFPELQAILSAPRKKAPLLPTPVESQQVQPAPPGQIAERAAHEPALPPVSVQTDQPPPAEKPLEVPLEGDLADLSPVRLYALCALTSASGWLTLELESGRMLTISFRRGTPEQLSSDDPELSLLRFFQGKQVITGQQALQAEEHATSAGVDLVSALFQLQLIPPADAHRLLGDYALFLLDRALLSWRGRFTFEADAPSPPGAFPLGQRWSLLAESVRRLEVPPLRARLGKRLLRPVLRSGGLGVGKVEQFALNAQESRLYAGIDGTRTGEELLKVQDPAVTVRMLYLLTQLGHLAFAEGIEDAPPPAPAAAEKPYQPLGKFPGLGPGFEPPPPAPPPQPAQPEPAKLAERPMPQRAPRTQTPPSVPRAAPPVMKAKTPSVQSATAPAPVSSKPIAKAPTLASGPAGELPGAELMRLQALRDKLAKSDHFEALGLDRKATTSVEVKRNFFALARELHPDTVTDSSLTELRGLKEALFARINEASQTLADETRRKAYEKELDGKANNVDVSRIFAAEENFERAEIMIKARKYKEGLDLLDQAIALNADEAEFYAWRGYARFLLSKDRKASFEESAADCRHAIKKIERCLPAHLFLGHMAKVIGEVKLAERCYQKVLQLDPKHVEAQRELRLMGKR